jgi:hypothetical protein
MSSPKRFSCLFALCAALALNSAAQTGSASGDYETKYDFLVGGVIVDVDGNEDKFRTERNLRSGFDAGRVFFDMRPVDPSTSKFDQLTLNSFGFGGSNPYSRADFQMNKRKLYDLKAGYRKYYNFFRLPEFALGWHDEDSIGRSYNVSLEMMPDRMLSFLVGYRRNQLSGTRYTSQDLRWDAYPVSYPRDLSSDDVFGGVKVKTRRASFRFIQSYIRTRNDQRLLPNGENSIGLRGNVLAEGERNVPISISTPVSRVLGAWRPSRKYDLNVRYMYSGADMDLTRSEDLLNRIGQGLFPIRQIISSSGMSEKPTHNFGFGQTWEIVERLVFHHRFSYDSYSLTGFLNTSGIISMIDENLGTSTDFPIEEAGGTQTDYKLARNEAELEFVITPSISLFGGHRYRNRHMAFGQAGTNPRPVVTIGNAGLGGVTWRQGRKARLRAEVEKGTATEAFNRIDPLDTLRWSIKSNFRPVEKLTLTANVLFEDNDNNQPDVNYDLDNRQVGLQAVYALPDKVLLSGGYNYLKIRTTTDIVYYALREMVDGFSLYETNTHIINSMLEAPVGSRVKVRGGYEYFNDTGKTYPLRMHIPRAGISIGVTKGISIETDWKYYSYAEKVSFIRDYNAHTIAIGVRFRNLGE